MTKMTGGELIALMLKNEGVEKVFGIIDGTYLGLNAALRKHGISLITPRHEACAMHMAGAYARLTGKLGVAIASNGPGVANVLPGVAVENGEGNRILLITRRAVRPLATRTVAAPTSILTRQASSSPWQNGAVSLLPSTAYRN